MSPSRLMAIMDPLLNTGFLWRCLAAYAGIQSDSEQPQDEITSNTVTTTADPPAPRKESFHDPEHMREDTYFARLSP